VDPGIGQRDEARDVFGFHSCVSPSKDSGRQVTPE
jgi:hypothetical protein